MVIIEFDPGPGRFLGVQSAKFFSISRIKAQCDVSVVFLDFELTQGFRKQSLT